MSDCYNGQLAASRKLTDEEAKELRTILVQSLTYSPEEQEDVNDLLDYTFAMTSNGKPLEYIVQELVSMEMDVCPEPQAHSLARLIATFLETRVHHQETEKEAESHVVSLKSSGKGNALTMSGALGASRERNKKKNDDSKKRDRSSSDRPNHPRGGGSRGRGNTDRRTSSGGRGAGRGRLTHSEAFQRLSGRTGRSSNDRRGGPSADSAGRPGRAGGAVGGSRGEMWRGGGRNDGRVSRGGRGSSGPRGRASPGQSGGRGGGRNAPMSGNRRSRDEMRGDEDFIPAGRGGPRDGRFQGRGDNRGGRRDGNRGGAGAGRRPDFEEGNKRPRTEDYGWEEPGGGGGGYSEWGGGYEEGYNDYNWRGSGRRGGGRASRGRGRGRIGRGFSPEGVEQQTKTDAEANGEIGGDAAEAAAGHPSPLVAASFGGRGYRGRGRGRGRGGRGGYRAQVVSMIASKTWVRPKKEEEGGDAGADGSTPNGNSATGGGGGEEM